jgi:methylated-DNA-protein-cysteine methyltransferase-like protein
MKDPQFKAIVWQTMAAIPPGKVATYGQIASLSGYPGHARGVGHILKKLPPETLLPWHRVINAKGEIALPAGSEGHQMQKQRLEQEGIHFQDDKIRLRLYQWDGIVSDQTPET